MSIVRVVSGAAVTFIFGLIGCVTVDRFPELSALMRVAKINEAEQVFRAKHGRFGMLWELGPDGAALIDGQFSSGSDGGYRFAVMPHDKGYTVVAMPNVWNVDGRRSFFSDETKLIRQSWTQEPADRNSPSVN